MNLSYLWAPSSFGKILFGQYTLRKGNFHRMRFIFCLFLGFLSISVFAQRGPEVGAWIGVSNYFGDVNPLFRLSEPGLAGGFIGRYNFNTRLSLRLGGSYALIRGDDANSSNVFNKQRNIRFRTHIFELTPAIELNFFKVVHGSRDAYFPLI